MYTRKTRLKTSYEPLMVSCSVTVDANCSPLGQTYNEVTGEYNPDRAGETGLPTIIVPVVYASSNDATWTNREVNSLLEDMHWLVNGQDITEVWNKEDYAVADGKDGTYKRGTLIVTKNIKSGTQCELHLEAAFNDSRTKDNYRVMSDRIMLSTTSLSQDEYAISVSRRLVKYDMFKDRLLERDYCVANGLEPDMDADDALRVGTPYKQTIAFTCYRGAGKITPDRGQVKLLLATGGGKFASAEDNDCVEEWDDTGRVTIDCRLLGENTVFRLQYVSPNNVCYADFQIRKTISAFNVEMCNTSSIEDGDTEKRMYAIVTVVGNENRKLPHPEAQLVMKWMTDCGDKTAVEHNEGSLGVINLKTAGVSVTDDELEVYLKIDYRSQASIVALADAIATSDGKTLLTN